MVVVVVNFRPKRELNFIFYAYQIQNFLRQSGSAPLHSARKLHHVFSLKILCEFLIFDQNGNEIVYLRPVEYKIFLYEKEAERFPLATPGKVFNHIFSVISWGDF